MKTIAIKTKKGKILIIASILLVITNVLTVIPLLNSKVDYSIKDIIFFYPLVVLFNLCVFIELIMIVIRPKVLISATDKALFIRRRFRTIKIRIDDILRVDIKNQFSYFIIKDLYIFKKIIHGFGSIKIITADEKYTIRGVADISAVKARIMLLKGKGLDKRIFKDC